MGIVCYFAGMLTSLRQARWYASRALGLGVALVVYGMAVNTPHFWQALVFILIGGAILATAVWGGFHSHGFYRGQPVPGQLALITALTLGCTIAFVFVTWLLLILLLRPNHWSQYQITKDGTIYQVTQKTASPPEIMDLEGKPLVDSKTGRAPEWMDLNRRICTRKLINPDFGDRAHSEQLLKVRTDNLFLFWRATPDTLWYYWGRYGRLAGYDKATRRFIGSLGPDGFSKDLSGTRFRFDIRSNNYEPVQARILNDAQTVFEPDLEHRGIKTLFTATNENYAAARLATNASRTTIGAVRTVSLNGNDWDYTIVVTRNFVRLLTPDGMVLWQEPYQPAYTDYTRVQVAFLEPNNRFALWIGPSRRAQEKADGKLPTHVTWLDRDGNVLKSADLPELDRPRKFSREDKLICLSVPPALLVMPPFFDPDADWSGGRTWVLLWFSLAAALVCIPVGWWLGWRYQFSLKTHLAWTVFYLFCRLQRPATSSPSIRRLAQWRRNPRACSCSSSVGSLSDELTLTWSPALVTAAFTLAEIPPDYSVPSGEIYGETVGQVGAPIFLFEIADQIGGTWYWTNYESAITVGGHIYADGQVKDFARRAAEMVPGLGAGTVPRCDQGCRG